MPGIHLDDEELARLNAGATIHLVGPLSGWRLTADATKSKPQAGICQYCLCTEDNACKLPNLENCAWANEERTVCTSYRCLKEAGLAS